MAVDTNNQLKKTNIPIILA
uniref:Uncharacterized protein n=1 Tax=Arundo donax TaxID=35708 RepID=A0A0A8ZQW4_ARUDO